MLYSTVVQRDETGFNQIYEAAREFEEENVMEAILTCKFNKKKVEQTLNLVRMYQCRLNNESMELVAFSEIFIEQYSTDHNECFRIAEKLVRRIGTTITGSMKIFRKFCPVVKRQLDKGVIVPTLDYSRLTFRQFQGQFFGVEAYIDLVQTLVHEVATFFYHLVTVLKLCKDMIRQEEEVMGNYERLKKIFEKSCDEVLHSVRDVFKTFGPVKLVSEEELEERRKNARPMKEWLARDYHAHDKAWLKREAYIYRLVSGAQYGLDEKARIIWAKDLAWGRKVCDVIPMLDTLHIPFKRSDKAKKQNMKGTFESREMLYLVKWSCMNDKGDIVVDELNEKQVYLYLKDHYKGEYLFPSWQAVCHERKFCTDEKISIQELASDFAAHLPQQKEAA